MDINCTLLLQGFHFFIAYNIFRWLLFKPVIAAAEADRVGERVLLGAIAQHKSAIAKIRKDVTQLWQGFHTSIRSDIPSDIHQEIHYLGITAPLDNQELPSEEKEHLVEICAKSIIEKVGDVRK